MHAKFYFEYFRDKKHDKQPLYLIKNFRATSFMLVTVFNSILKQLFDLISVCISVMKKDNSASTTETSVVQRHIGKELGYQANFVW